MDFYNNNLNNTNMNLVYINYIITFYIALNVLKVSHNKRLSINLE